MSMRSTPFTVLVVAGLIACTALSVQAAEGEKGEKAGAKIEVKKEARDTMPLGTRGVSEGTVVSKEAKKGSVVLQTEEGNLLFVPNWKGGREGGLDKTTIEKVATIKVGDTVRISWSWEDRRRIDTITAVK